MGRSEQMRLEQIGPVVAPGRASGQLVKQALIDCCDTICSCYSFRLLSRPLTPVLGCPAWPVQSHPILSEALAPFLTAYCIALHDAGQLTFCPLPCPCHRD